MNMFHLTIHIFSIPSLTMPHGAMAAGLRGVDGNLRGFQPHRTPVPWFNGVFLKGVPQNHGFQY